MSGNGSELPDGGGGDDSTRLRDRARTQFQRRAQQARRAAGRTREAAASAAASAGNVRERAAEQLENFSAEDLERTGDGEVRVSDAALRERAAEQSETAFTPGDFEIVTEDGQRVAQLSESAREQRQREQAAGVLDQKYEAVEITADDVDISDGEAAIVGAAREQIQRQQAAEDFDEQFADIDIGVQDVALAEDGVTLTSDAQTELQRQQAAEQFDAQFSGLDIGPDDIEITDAGATVTGDARQQLRRREAAEQFDEQFDEVDVTASDVTLTDEGATVNEEVAQAQSAQEILEETGGAPVGFSDPGASAAEVIAQEQDVNQRIVINTALDRSGASDLRPRADDPVEIAAALEPEAVEKALEISGDQAQPFRDRFRAPDGSVGADLDVAIAQFDETVAQRRQLAENDPEQFIEQLDFEDINQLRQTTQSSQLRERREFQAERDARVDAANELNDDIADVDIDSRDITLEDGQAQLEGTTVETIQRQREQQAREQAAAEFEGFDADDIVLEDGTARVAEEAVEQRRDQARFNVRQQAADQFDEQVSGQDIDIDDVTVSDTGDGFEASLDADARQQFEQQQRQQARADAAAELDAETGVNVTAEDVTLEPTDDGGFQATLDEETAGAVGDRRQDIAREITPDDGLPSGDVRDRFDGLQTETPTISDGLGVDASPEVSRPAEGLGDVGQFVREDVLPAGGGAAIGAAASTFRGSFDPGREATGDIVDRLEGPAERIDSAVDRGIGISTDVTSDVVAGATPLPEQAVDPAFDTIEGGAEIGAASLNPARIAQDTARAPGLTLRGVDAATGEQAAENIQFGADVTAAGAELAAEEGPEFVRENPQRSAEFAIGGTIAIGGGALLGTAATRGAAGAARGARRTLGDIDLDARRFAADDRGQLDLTFGSDTDTDTGSVDLGELDDFDADEATRDAPDDFDPVRVTDREVFDAPEAGPRRPEASFSQSFTQRTTATRRSDVPDRFDRGETAAEANPSFSDRATFDAGPTISREALAPDVDVGDAAPAVRRGGDDVDAPPDPLDTSRGGAVFGASTAALLPDLAAVDPTAATQQRLDSAQQTSVAAGTDDLLGTGAEQLTGVRVRADSAQLTDVFADAGLDSRGAVGIDTDVGEVVDTRQGTLTGQRLDQEQSLLLEQEQELAQTGTQTTTTSTRPISRTTVAAPRLPPTTSRVRPDLPDLPDVDGDDDALPGFGAIGANFENPTRTLTEADELVTEIGEGFDAPR